VESAAHAAEERLGPASDAGAERSAEPRPSPAAAAATVARLERSVARVIRGKPEAIRLAVISLLGQGHVLIEDVPGVGKTTLAQALARSVGLAFQRVQFTSDLLPSDIIGSRSSTRRSRRSSSSPGRCSPTSCSPTRSTGRPRRPSRRCSRR
jgi:MoxR-like ATPase